MANKAWVTLATNDTYALGALVLAHSLKKVNTAYKLVVLVSSNVTFAMRGTLQSVFDEVKEVNILDSGDTENLRLLARPELGITFTKFHCWKLTQFEKCVFLDADTLVLQNCDELFEREELSAAPDVGWPDCFNSGVFVFKPSEETFKALCDFAIVHGSFDGGDQGLLNMFFSNWATSDASKRLPFLYNLSSAAVYSYLPAFKWYGKGVKIVHFIGNSKPWQQPFNSSTRTVEAAPGSSHLQNFLQYWWDLFCAYVYPQLSPEMTRLLLRSWYTPRITIKNYPSRNNPMHNEVYIPELFVAPEVEEHFIFTDPWEEFEKNIAASVESSDNINVIGYRSTNDTEKSYNEIVHHNHKTYEEQPLVYNNYQPSLHKDYHHYDRLNNCSSPASDQTFIESSPVHNQCSVDVYNAPDVHTLPNFTVCDNRNHSSNDKPQNCENERINVNNETCITEDISHTCSSVKNSFSCDISVNYNSLHSLKNEILREETHYSETKSEINDDGGLANSLAQMKLEEPTPEQKARDDFLRKQNWEQGNIDYMGRDSFSNIWEKISQTMNFEPESKTEEKASAVQSSPAPSTTTEQSTESSTKVDSIKSPTSISTSEQPISIPKSSEPAATKTIPSSPAPVPVSSQVASTTPVADESAPKSSAAPACPRPAPSAAVPVASTTPVPESTPAPTTAKPVAAPVCPKPAPSPTASAPVSSSTPVAEKSTPAPVTSKPVAAPACPKSALSAPTPVPATESTPAPTTPNPSAAPGCPKPAAPAAPIAKSSQEGKPAPSTKSTPSKK